MKITLAILATASIFLTACNSSSSGGSGSGGGPGTLGGNEPIANDGSVTDWQTTSIGQEGHGGDAIVCFNVPVSQALQKIDLRKKTECVPSNTNPCLEKVESGVQPIGDGGSSTPPDVIWKMTALGRKSIKSAKPLEQYLAERISSKKKIIAELNSLSVEEGFANLIKPLNQLPSAYSKISSIHNELGWLKNDGVANEFGLADINDSGFVNETEIDTTYCKELQAVIRRDTQLWYDKDIVDHFDNAGLVLMQLHEVIYAWGKGQDTKNQQVYEAPAHKTSEKTRRLILKLLDSTITTDNLNQQLKDHSFSIYYSSNIILLPTSIGYFMTSESCQGEQRNLRSLFNSFGPEAHDFRVSVSRYFDENFLGKPTHRSYLNIIGNYPDNFAAMIAYTNSNASFNPNFRQNLYKYLDKFELPQSCSEN